MLRGQGVGWASFAQRKSDPEPNHSPTGIRPSPSRWCPIVDDDPKPCRRTPASDGIRWSSTAAAAHRRGLAAASPLRSKRVSAGQLVDRQSKSEPQRYVLAIDDLDSKTVSRTRTHFVETVGDHIAVGARPQTVVEDVSLGLSDRRRH